MLNKYNFELALERIAEKFYFGGASQYGKKRGGNSSDNEAYFRNVAVDLRSMLNCQQILLKKGACPDSGVFGDFDYKNEDDVNWRLVEENKIVVLEVSGVERQKRYIEVRVEEAPKLQVPVKKDPKITMRLNEVNGYGEFFGVEYKASRNKSEKSITVASFNSTCPSSTKTSSVKVKLIHNLESKNKFKIHNYDLRCCDLTLEINFSIYYMIINDEPEGQISVIKQIFVCDGGFFAPDMSEERAKELSKQLYPEDLKKEYSLYRVGLRYRPFFDSKTIRANGFGLYTSWEPKIPKEEEVERQRQQLLDEVEKIQQSFSDSEEEVESTDPDMPDNVIYLNLRDERIKKRAA